MGFLLAGAAVLAVLLLAAWLFTNADPGRLARLVRYTLGGTLVAAGGLLAIGGRWGPGLVLAALGLSVISVGRIGPFDLGSARPRPGSQSAVRSRYLAMRLDHDSGALKGTVTAGSMAGRSLDELALNVLEALLVEVGDDADSVALLEGYLDRRFPRWREDLEGDRAARPGRAADSGAMTDEEAYEVLGLAPGASEAEIRAAHRRLMKRFHPDQGGTSFLAAKINQAKDRLLG
jgi:hypothetical protein